MVQNTRSACAEWGQGDWNIHCHKHLQNLSGPLLLCAPVVSGPFDRLCGYFTFALDYKRLEMANKPCHLAWQQQLENKHCNENESCRQKYWAAGNWQEKCCRPLQGQGPSPTITHTSEHTHSPWSLHRLWGFVDTYSSSSIESVRCRFIDLQYIYWTMFECSLSPLVNQWTIKMNYAPLSFLKMRHKHTANGLTE